MIMIRAEVEDGSDIIDKMRYLPDRNKSTAVPLGQRMCNDRSYNEGKGISSDPNRRRVYS